MVEYASTRLMSRSTHAMVAASSAVSAPTHAISTSSEGTSANNGYTRATMYTPAVTMVAAWISADTGVGPSIASGSQVWSGSWADLAKAPTRISRQTATITHSFCE